MCFMTVNTPLIADDSKKMSLESVTFFDVDESSIPEAKWYHYALHWPMWSGREICWGAWFG